MTIERVTIPSSLGELSAAVALPKGAAKGPAVVIIHEWWGVNEQIQTVAQRWAEEGFVAIVPDLYDGKTAKDADEAGKMMKALDFGKAVQQIGAAVEWGRGHERSTGKVAVTGYCMGGALTLATAVNVRGLSATVAFYGLPGDLDWSKVDAPIQAHFAQHDDWATVAGAEKIKAAVKVPMELHVYDAQHAFCNDRRPEVYNADAAQQAWGRTVAFVRKHTT
ncbi:MAG TPA: dienelactone hydrolase family protein [Kofleriaceae bacterium]|nr:dienelactone hydrolase family protein [Kofleriaceae bacterium]